jgi:hypothetical protein
VTAAWPAERTSNTESGCLAARATFAIGVETVSLVLRLKLLSISIFREIAAVLPGRKRLCHADWAGHGPPPFWQTPKHKSWDLSGLFV